MIRQETGSRAVPHPPGVSSSRYGFDNQDSFEGILVGRYEMEYLKH